MYSYKENNDQRERRNKCTYKEDVEYIFSMGVCENSIWYIEKLTVRRKKIKSLGLNKSLLNLKKN